ncbi:MAG: hypothetical protein WC662_04105, partial [Candidatus Paceibacterota bacterium]
APSAKKIPAPHSSRTLLRGGNPNPAEFQKELVSVLRILPPAKLLRKTESIFSERLISCHLSRSVDCVPRFSPLEKLCITQARVARARHAGDFQLFLIK